MYTEFTIHHCKGKEMNTSNREDPEHSIEILPEGVPVAMPELPLKLVISTVQQFKALGDRTRERILAIIQHQPATAKQLAERLGLPPGTVGHHLQVLEAADLAQVIARRLTRGTVAKYYSRTARIFVIDMAREVTGGDAPTFEMMTRARDELIEAMATIEHDPLRTSSVPRARLSFERAQIYSERVQALVEDFLHETPDSQGDIYELCAALFMAPAYLQDKDSTMRDESSADQGAMG
jgi:DNA-binding transcriptional ArsR family regulator